jgi:hypothetical protein
MNRRQTFSALLACWLGMGLAATQPATAADPAAPTEADLASRLAQACQTLAAGPAVKPAGRLVDLELFWLAELLEYQGDKAEVRRTRRYLATYRSKSPLLPLLPPLELDGDMLSDFTPDPDWSRMVKSFYQGPWGPLTPTDPDLEAAVALSLDYLEGIRSGGLFASMADFVKDYPESRFAGWAVYEQAWALWLQAGGDTSGFSALQAQHPEHPLAAEAAEAAAVRYFDPQAVAWHSSLLPGWGEELLEPGARESSSQLYSELMFAAGAIGFAIASQVQSRRDNLIGSAIFVNLLLMNHRGSAEQAYQLAQHRNWTDRNRFLRQRLEAPLAGQGRFQALEPPVRPAPAMADELEAAFLYKLRGVDEGFRGRGWINDEELMNMGWQVRWRHSLVQTSGAGPVATALAVAPRLRYVFTHANTRDPDRFREPLRSYEWSLGAELLGLLRWQLGGSWLQGSLGAGPIWRNRSLTFAPYSHADQGPALAASAGLEWGGPSGTFWQAAAWYEDDFKIRVVEAAPGPVAIPGSGEGVQFSLGIRF